MTLPESRRRKLEMLTRSILRGDVASAARLLQSHGPAAVNRPGAAPSQPLPLEQACGGAESRIATPCGQLPCHLVRRTLDQVGAGDVAIASEYSQVLRGARQRLDELAASPALCHAADARPEDVLFLDTETCGLGGTMIFLVGLMSYQGGQLLFEQYLARDYSEEPAVLHAFAKRCEAAGVLVSFNGKAFDMALIRERAAFHAVEVADPGRRHLDLLHESRRRWRSRLPNCRLQTLESYLIGRRRVGDIPGWAIPDAYHRFVATGDARELRDIVHHNLLDLLTMAQLLCLVLTNTDPL